MRITFVIDSLGSGGAERILTIMANYWCAKGYSISVITLTGANRSVFYKLDKKILLNQLGIELKNRRGLSKIFMAPKLFITLRRTLKKNCPDVIISFMDQTNIFCIIAGVGLGIPTVVSERVYPAYSSLFESDKTIFIQVIARIVRPLTYYFASTITILTESCKKCFPSFLHKCIETIPNPVLPAEFQEPDTLVPSRCIIAMGRLHGQKRFDLLIQAFSEVNKFHPDWSLLIFGEGPLKTVLQDQIEYLGLVNCCRLAGVTKTPYGVMSRGEIFVSSSDYEGFPGALCQAMSCGKAVIATNCPSGPDEIIRDGIDGILVQPGNANALSKAMLDLVNDPSRRSALGKCAKEVVQRFNLDAIMIRWEDLIGKVLARTQ